MHEEHVELLIGRDHSVVVRHIQGGETEARHVIAHFFGEVPADSYRRPALWDWVRFEPGAIPPVRLEAVRKGEAERTLTYETSDGTQSVAVRVREVDDTPHFDLPRFSMTQVHGGGGAKWKVPVAIVVGIGVILIAAQIQMGKGARFEPATFAEVLTAHETPATPPSLLDKIRRSDGEHHEVSLAGQEILQSLGNAIVVQTAGGDGYFLTGPGLGGHARNLMQSAQPLHVDTSQGPGGKPRFVNGSGQLVAFDVRPIALEQPSGGYAPVGGNDSAAPAALEVGGRYILEGGLKATGKGILLYSPSFAQVKHIALLEGVPSELMETVVRHAVDNSIGVAAYGTVTETHQVRGRNPGYIDPRSELPTVTMKPDILRLSTRVFVRL